MKIFQKILILLSIYGVSSFLPNQPINQIIVRKASSLLGDADSVGHHILHLNKEIINFLLDHQEISMQYKKPFILFLIQTSQNGDAIGGHILENYYNLVNNLL